MARTQNVPDPRHYPTTAAYQAALDAALGPKKDRQPAIDAPLQPSTPSNPNMPRQTPVDPGQQQRANPAAQNSASGSATAPATYATLNSSGVMIPGQVADTTYTVQPRDHVPKASDAWASSDETADGGVNWKGTGDLKTDHPDWWGEVKNYDPATQQRMLNDYKTGDEANFQNERDDARARHMVASGWANPDGSTPTAKITKPDPTGTTASSAWMSDSSTPSTTPDTTTTAPVADTSSTRTMPTTPDSTDTTPNKVSTGDIGGVDMGSFPGLGTPSASSIWTSPEAAQQPKDQIGNEPQVDTNTMTMPDGTTMPDMSMPAPDASATDAAQDTSNPDNPDNPDDQALRLKLPTY